MDEREQVTNAILLLGHKPDQEGNIQEGVKIRADFAAELYRKKVAPVIIPSGWYWPKDEALKRFREAEIIEQYLYREHGTHIKVLCEPYSTSIPENLLFTWRLFPGLKRLRIVSGELFMDRTKFLASMIFGDQVRLTYAPCRDKLSDRKTQQRLLANVQCIFRGVTPGEVVDFMGLSSLPDGTLQSRWRKINEEHRSCPLHS